MARKKRIIMLEEKLKKIVNLKEIKTQDIRVTLINELTSLFKTARDMAHSAEGEGRQAWMRVCAYIAQVINSLANSYDEVRFNKQMSELEQMIEEARRKTAKQTPVA